MTVVIKKGMSKVQIEARLKKLKGKDSGFPAHKFTGKLKVDEDPLTIQKRLRDEWS
jgi:hypothetical protein